MAMPIASAEGGAPSSPQKRRVTPAPPAAASMGGGAAAPAAGTATALRLSDSLPGVEVHVPPSASGGSRLCVLRNRLAGVRDELAGVDRGIQEKEVLRGKLDEKLVNIDEQLATPGLSGKDKDHLLAKWRSVDGDKQVSNAALAGLYHDKRRIQDSLVALELEIRAEEAARSKADTEGPSVLERLVAVRLPDLSAQYASQQLHGQQFELRGSDGVVQTLQTCALHNLAPAAGRSTVLVVSGPAGSGKTRVGFEALCRSSGLHGDLLHKLEQSAGCSVLTIPLFIDFNNGFKYVHSVDVDNMDLNLGVRLAARALRVSVAAVKSDNGGSSEGLEVAEVLTAIAKSALRQASGAAASPPGVIVLALHLDEYQFYVQRLMMSRGHSEEEARLCFKDMLSAVNIWICSASAAVGAKLVFFPVVTGTPVAGLELLLTDKLREVDLSPGRLELQSASALFSDVVSAPARLSHLKETVTDASRNTSEARNALGDTDFRPRFVVTLGEAVRDQLLGMADAGREPSPFHADWAAAVHAVVATIDRPTKPWCVEVLAQLALARVPVCLFPPPTREPSLAERVVQEASSVGSAELDAVQGNFRVVRVPLVQLRRWGLTVVLPARLLSQTVCTWQQVEQILGYCLTAALQPGLWSSPPSTRDLFPRALGSDHLPSQELILDKRRSLYVEETQFISSRTRIARKQMSVRARIESGTVVDDVMLTDGVFLTCPGSVAVDIRFSVATRLPGGRNGTLHVFVQTKHTATVRRIGESAIDEWYRSVNAATKQWRGRKDRVLFVYFSNKAVTDDGAAALGRRRFFEDRPDLLVITLDQLSYVLPDFLMTRILTTEQQSRQEMGRGVRLN